MKDRATSWPRESKPPVDQFEQIGLRRVIRIEPGMATNSYSRSPRLSLQKKDDHTEDLARKVDVRDVLERWFYAFKLD
jgi:hypothetical protein